MKMGNVFFFQTKQTKQIFWNKIALPEMNMAPKNRPSQKEIHLPTTIFQVQAVTFREGACQSPTKHMFQCQDLISIEFRRWMTSWKGQFQVSYCWATGTPDLSPIRLEKQSRVEYPKIYVHRFQTASFWFQDRVCKPGQVFTESVYELHLTPQCLVDVAISLDHVVFLDPPLSWFL